MADALEKSDREQATALAEAESIDIELGADPESELGAALAEARAALSGSDA